MKLLVSFILGAMLMRKHGILEMLVAAICIFILLQVLV